MIGKPPQGKTHLLEAQRRDNGNALDRLIPVDYDELPRLAHCHMARELTDNPLQTTALVHEAHFRLAGAHKIDWKKRVHFFAVSANLTTEEETAEMLGISPDTVLRGWKKPKL